MCLMASTREDKGTYYKFKEENENVISAAISGGLNGLYKLIIESDKPLNENEFKEKLNGIKILSFQPCNF